MRMCICLTWRTMCCPTSMSNTTSAANRSTRICFIRQIAELTRAFITSTRFSPSRTAIPAESSLLYSSLDNSSNNTGAACFAPVKPTIPQIYLRPPCGCMNKTKSTIRQCKTLSIIRHVEDFDKKDDYHST